MKEILGEVSEGADFGRLLEGELVLRFAGGILGKKLCLESSIKLPLKQSLVGRTRVKDSGLDGLLALAIQNLGKQATRFGGKMLTEDNCHDFSIKLFS